MPDELDALHMPLAHVDAGDGDLVAHALAFDRFGNVMLDVEHEELDGSGLKLGHPVLVNGEPAHYATTFADVPAGALLLYEDAYRALVAGGQPRLGARCTSGSRSTARSASAPRG